MFRRPPISTHTDPPLPYTTLCRSQAARAHLLVKDKALTRVRDGLAAERRRRPWMAVEQAYAFEGPMGTASLLDLFEGRRQLIVYRAFFEQVEQTRTRMPDRKSTSLNSSQ